MRARSVLAGLIAGAAIVVTAGAPASAAETPLPTRTAVLNATRAAASYYAPTFAVTTLTPKNGWSWSTYAQGVRALFAVTGDQRYRDEGLAWGRTSSWGLSTERNPDSIKAGQVYLDWHRVDPAADLTTMDARMKADLTGLPASQYDWADALFMGLPNWALWAQRTGDVAYASRMDDFYLWMRDSGASGPRCGTYRPSQPGPYDASAHLWYRDCAYVGALATAGKRVFWGGGNGWVLAAMASVIASLPAGDPRAGKYADMLRLMSSRLAALQGSDGMWRASLEDPVLFPQPETSATALITYALAAGVREGVLDAATYRPVIARAWQGLTTIALQPSGFLRSCQPNGFAPAATYTSTAPRTAPGTGTSGSVNADSPPFCVGAFLLAGAEIAAMTPDLAVGRPVTATTQQTGNEVRRLVDGDVTTRWSASGFPQSARVDLGVATRIGETMVTTYLDRAYRYRIECSTDAAAWAVLVDRTQSPTAGTILDSFAPASCRHVRLVVTGVSGATTTWVSIQEFGIYAAPDAQVIASDSFERTVTGGLGSASPGGAWTLSGSAAAFAVSGGVARFTVKPSQGVAGYLTWVAASDLDLSVTAGLASAPAGGPGYLAVLARHNGVNHYGLKLKRPATGSATLSLVRDVSGAEATLAATTLPSALAATDLLRLRVQLTTAGGTTGLRARAWKVGTPEPGTWSLTASDSTAVLRGAGGIGLWAYLSSSATNPQTTIVFDDLVATRIG